MSTTRLIMAKRKNTPYLIIWNATSDDLVGTIFEQVWIVPIEIFHLGHEFAFVLFGPR